MDRDIEFQYKVNQQVAVKSSCQYQAFEDVTNPAVPHSPTLGVLCLEDVPREMLGLLPGW